MDVKEIVVNGYIHVSLDYESVPQSEVKKRSEAFFNKMNKRRSVRSFSDQPIPKSVIEDLIKTASTAPSGAHKQPWTFCAVSDPKMKHQIRMAAEKEEKETYESRMSDQWRKDLAPMGTDMHKPFLEIAPWLIIVFKKPFDYDDKGEKSQNYYVNESVGLAAGMLITAIHEAGLVTLTHTPSPMRFLTKLLNRPDNERPFLLLPVGFPADGAYVPDIQRKELNDVARFFEG